MLNDSLTQPVGIAIDAEHRHHWLSDPEHELAISCLTVVDQLLLGGKITNDTIENLIANLDWYQHFLD